MLLHLSLSPQFTPATLVHILSPEIGIRKSQILLVFPFVIPERRQIKHFWSMLCSANSGGCQPWLPCTPLEVGGFKRGSFAWGGFAC